MDLSDLNDIQAAAVKCVDAPVLIYAGAGSGKTRVLAHKIAYLVEEVGLEPSSILSVTFTNKAAGEMKRRAAALLPRLKGAKKSKASVPVVGTFHSICARLLRNDIHHLGYQRDFVIYDKDDQVKLIKSVLEEHELDMQLYPPQYFQTRFSNAKNALEGADELRSRAKGKDGEILATVFDSYQKALRRNNALDFDDLLLLPLELFSKHKEVRDRYRERFKYILVDEYQDTNKAQFEFVKHLAEESLAITVVGDDDQSIYGWRGADIGNILNFHKTFKGAEIFKLEQNYRSSNVILKAAYEVVSRNRMRTEKKLWTAKEGGALIRIIVAEDERKEAEIVFQRIQHEVLVKKRRFGDLVVLYRTNAQSRAIEDVLRRRAIAYTIVGGPKFYERKEIKDVMAYLKLLVNPSDSVSLDRIINFPPRAIGDTSMNRLRAFSRDKDISLFASLDDGVEAGVQPKQAQAMRDFKGLIERYRELMGVAESAADAKGKSNSKKRETNGRLGVVELVTTLLEETRLREYYRNQGTSESIDRTENIKSLIDSIEYFMEDNPEADLSHFLEEMALLTDVDRWNDSTNSVTLMTLHSAKGLEFPVVIMTGMEEGLFPLMRTDDTDMDEEEERRLFYVGITRAEEQVY
ncbi:MAG: UvrD-helicase domain-containing protein, partial [Candidatus Marinimicrobia bacterium]|nr:UvrD-helicase domain-containing protein [Candidatus Neomarinimicrobiota bacterium]